jgi:outer membrane immunogenic protein
MTLSRRLAIICLAVLSYGSASAADLSGPSTLKFEDGAPAPIWTGLYIGANAGLSLSGGTANGLIGGAQIGYNYQMGHLVLGIEADLSYDSYLLSSVTSATSAGWVGSIRPRLGFAQGPWLFYVTGGLAFGDPSLSSLTSSSGDFRTGWTAGAGIEYALNRNLSLRLEYLHTDLGASTNTSDTLTDDVVRLGVNFRF